MQSLFSCARNCCALVVVGILVASPSGQAEVSKSQSLKQVAQEEIGPIPPKQVGAPIVRPATVDTESYLNEREGASPGYWELGLNAQSYHPAGEGQISNGERYDMSQLQRTTLWGLKGRRWFDSFPSFKEERLRAGAAGTLQYNRVLTDLRTGNGYVYKDMRIGTLLATLGPQVEWLLPGLNHISLGTYAELGPAVVVQSNRLAEANESRSSLAYRLGGELKVYPWQSLFTSVAYEYRGLRKPADGLRLQSNNILASVGAAF